MSVINRPDYKIFGQDARTGEMDAFPDILRGWGVTLDQTAGKPPLEWFNALGRRVDEWLLYLTQRGIAEWEKTVDYPKSAVTQHAGVIYIALRPTRDEPPDLSQNSWKTLPDSLGLGGGSALPVGVPVPWPSATPPAGWLKCNGAAFDGKKYPALAVAYPSGNLPDLRGEFIRGWDDGRGVDIGRSLLSAQSDAIQNIVGTFGRTQLLIDSISSGPFRQGDALLSTGLTPSTGNTGFGAPNWSFDASRSVRTATETRARNISFNYIVRAA